MAKNLGIWLVVAVVIVFGGYLYLTRVKSSNSMVPTDTSTQSSDISSPESNSGVVSPAPVSSTTSSLPAKPQPGDTLADLPVAQYAYQVYPGTLTSDAKKALIGWAITTKNNSDGSAEVTLTPNKADDQKVSYTVAKGQKLYFVEMISADDNQSGDQDKNLNDDYGIIVDGSGIVQ